MTDLNQPLKKFFETYSACPEILLYHYYVNNLSIMILRYCIFVIIIIKVIYIITLMMIYHICMYVCMYECDDMLINYEDIK